MNIRENNLLTDDQRQCFTKRLTELENMKKSIGNEYFPDKKIIEDLDEDIEAVKSALQYDDYMRENIASEERGEEFI